MTGREWRRRATRCSDAPDDRKLPAGTSAEEFDEHGIPGGDLAGRVGVADGGVSLVGEHTGDAREPTRHSDRSPRLLRLFPLSADPAFANPTKFELDWQMNFTLATPLHVSAGQRVRMD